ncbi:MAG: hypothetical protein KF861_01840 [Planctomycetaceae bacterium]|nr:hypothetical protein [Planctomycetaceae bacterium]
MNATDRMTTVRHLGGWLIAAALVIPVAWTPLVINGRPLEIMPADLLLVALPFCMGRWWRQSRHTGEREPDLLAVWLRRVAIALILYCGLSGTIGFLTSGDVICVLSAAKLVKPFLFLWIGGFLAESVEPQRLLRRIAWSFAAVMALWAASTVGDAQFPATAWGSNWLGLHPNGFPNLAMTFAAAMLPLLFAVCDGPVTTWQRLAARWAIATTFLLIVCSLSRCAAVVMFSAVSIYLLLTGGR